MPKNDEHKAQRKIQEAVGPFNVGQQIYEQHKVVSATDSGDIRTVE